MEGIEELSTPGALNGGNRKEEEGGMDANGKELQVRKGFGGLVRSAFKRLPLFMRGTFHYLWIPAIIGAGLLFVKPKVRIGNVIFPINIFGGDKKEQK